ncbi:MlaD family protein [Nocardia bhagyanarayanae]|uniref:ABC-type transporter Mla subunit MlaD n=1 Tax=Nocardia bhagyanarayanae TaxID=1215925 RepID=A0A543FGS1_9NOCA|nr:MlaD family protein [Nocardia bhagyanarayanae]TQM33057.1 ABC-type transporter Mla subunit MlaD [Nocardia bhagyanarayanae]
MTARSVRRAALVPVLALGLLSGCGFDPAQVPVPGATVSGPTYQVRIELANALNLPARAKVVANGAQIGSLREVSVVDPTLEQPGRVEAVVEIAEGVRLPVGTTVQLRQNTILGDIYIGLSTPAGDFDRTIPPGGTIPLARTRPALQVEDLLAGMSTFVGGGAMQQMQDIVNRVNATLPDRPAETARIFEVVGRDVSDVAADMAVVDRFLDTIQRDLDAALDNPRELDALLSERGSVEIPADAKSLILTLGVVGGLGIVGHAIAWLGPLLEASDAAAKALVPLLFADRPLDLTAPSNLNRVVSLVRDKIIPFVERGPKLNIGAVAVDGAAAPVATDEQVQQIIATLRMIGVVR